MKKLLTLSLALTMAVSLYACGSESKDSGSSKTAETTTVTEKLTPADQLLEDVKGTYDELFTVICDPKYNQVWLDKCGAIVGEDMAESCAEMLKSSCSATIYGEEAVEAYSDPESMQFDCFFINGVNQFVFDGSNISGLDDSGKKMFDHEYKFVKDFSLGGIMDGYLYETSDNDAGEFKYFLMMTDTPATTYHIEFRYGSDLDALAEYNKGAYAYWLAAGIPSDYDDKLIENVIGLFAEENLSGMDEEESSEEESSDKIEIGTAEELADFAKSVTDGSMDGYAGKTVLLTDDIDCTDIEWTPIGTMNLDDLNDYSCMFQGVFDGQGHKISNITYATDTPVCGVGIIGMNLGEVKNLTAENINIAVHVDHSHVHNHIIVNNVNFYTGKTFETEHNQGKIPDRAWSKLRTISDELCRKHGLSIIENPHLSKGKSHWEWELDKQNLSWKEQLKRAIDEVIKVSEDFEDFLAKCADFGILVDYNPDHKIDLKFMLAEQKERNPRAKFTRSKTLGYFYESQQIRRRIESYKYQMSHRPTARIIRTTAEKFQQSQGLQNWADRENMKAASKALNEMNASNSTLEELESAAHRAFAEFMVKSTPQFELSDRIHELEKQIPAIEEYRKYKVYYKNYTSLEGKSKKKYGENCRYELDQYHECRKKLKELFPNGIIPKIKDLQDELKKAREDYAKMSAERKALKKEADRLSRLAQQKRDSQRTVQRYLQNEQAAKRKKSQLE